MIRGGEPAPAEAIALALVALFAVAIAVATWRLAPPECWRSRGARRRSGLLGAAQRQPLLAYFALAYTLTWLFWLPIALTRNGVGLVPLGLPITLMMGGPLGPIGAGFLMTAIVSGGSGVRDLLRRLVLWRVAAGWHAFAILGPVPLFWLGLVLVSGDARTIPDVGALLAALRSSQSCSSRSCSRAVCSRSPAGGGLRCRDSSSGTDRSGARSSWACAGAAGTCRCSSYRACTSPTPAWWRSESLSRSFS